MSQAYAVIEGMDFIGKSTLVDALCARLTQDADKLGYAAVRKVF